MKDNIFVTCKKTGCILIKFFLTRDEALSFLASESANLGYELSRVYPYREALSSVLGYLSPVSEEDLQANAQLSLNSRVGSMGLEQFFDHQLQAQPLHSSSNQCSWSKTTSGCRKAGSLWAKYRNCFRSLFKSSSVSGYGGKKGAVIIMDASNGELLALVNSPSFDANLLKSIILIIYIIEIVNRVCLKLLNICKTSGRYFLTVVSMGLILLDQFLN
jgi:cell division protein FtsI/penicillin-binding protein 2